MGTIETEAVILRTYKLAEADKIVVCLTKSEGTVRGVARGARRLKSRFGASLEPFTHTALSYYKKDVGELVTFRGAEIIKSHFALSERPEAIICFEHFSQLVMEFAPPHQPDEKLFRLVTACFDAAAEGNPETIRPYFEFWLLRLNGLLPDLGVCGYCGRLLKAGGEAVAMTTEGAMRCSACADGINIPLDPSVHKQLYSMSALGPAKWSGRYQALGARQRKEISRLATWLTLRALERHPDTREGWGRQLASVVPAT